MSSDANSQTYLIDGYNVIFACGLYGKHVSAESLASARDRLLDELQARFADCLDTVAVVFDANKISFAGQRESTKERGIQVFYSIHHANADLMIDDLLQQHPQPCLVTVITSDHWLQNAARRRKASFIDSEAWYFQDQPAAPVIPSVTTESREAAKQAAQLTQHELDQLEQDIHKIQQEVQRELATPDGSVKAVPKDAKGESSLQDDKKYHPFPQEILDDLARRLSDGR